MAGERPLGRREVAAAARALALLAGGLLLAAAPSASAAAECVACHPVAVSGPHARLGCAACHAPGGDPRDLAAGPGAPGCTGCHPATAGVLHGAMATRRTERAFVEAAFGSRDPHFFQRNCTGCHVSTCLDCHGDDGHAIVRPGPEGCHRCHRGYFVGADYLGRSPREDALRYQRGPTADGERHLKMRPDLHAEAGMACGACHTMESLAAGRRTGKRCTDCHAPSPRVLEHRLGDHLGSLECWACHSAWGAQEYGTFFVRVGTNPVQEYFRVKREPGAEYVRSAYLRRQDAPPLGLNAAGRVSPIRPQFILFHSDLRTPAGEENARVASRWKPYFPHTVRRGTVPCEGCHAAPRRLMLEPETTRIHRPDLDGLGLPSFWSQQGQELSEGRFLTPEEGARIGTKSTAYRKGAVEKWKELVQSVETSSGR